MKRMLMAIMAIAVAVTFSAPAFAEGPKDGGKDKKPGKVVETIYGDEKKKEEKGKADETFAEEKGKKGGKADDTFGDKKEKPGK